MSGQADVPRRRCEGVHPQVGASTQAIGSTQPGSRASGIRNPQIVQTGNSNRFPTIQAARKRTKASPSGSRASRSRRSSADRDDERGPVRPRPARRREHGRRAARCRASRCRCGDRERDRQEGRPERRRRGDEELEDPERRCRCSAARRGRRQRPDAHHGRPTAAATRSPAAGRPGRGSTPSSRRSRRADDDPEEERVARLLLEVQLPAERHRAEEPSHARSAVRDR